MLLHTADWHLGKVLDGVCLLAEQRELFSRFCDEVNELQPELMLVCGDLFDFAGKTEEARELFDDIMSRITREVGCPVVITTGNHDDVKMTLDACKPYPNVTYVHAYGHPPMQFTVDGNAVWLYPFPYMTVKQQKALGAESLQQALEMQIASMPRVLSMNCFHVAMAHGLILPQGNESVAKLLAANKDNGATLVDSALFSAFDYTALGHIHANLFAEYRCYYASSPLTYDKKEIGQPKGYNTVSFAGGFARVTRHPLYQKHPVMRLSGSFDEIERDPPAQAKLAYLYLELEDTLPKTDGLARMKAIFPNLVNLRYRLPEVRVAAGEEIAEQFAVFLSHCGFRVDDAERESLKQIHRTENQP